MRYKIYKNDEFDSVNNITSENHKKPILLGKLSRRQLKRKIEILQEYEKNIKDDKIEDAIVITQEDEVYQCFGNKNSVWPGVDLGDKLQGAWVTHNHPIEETMFSFSRSDMKLFEKYELKLLRGIDEKYTYEFNSIKSPVLKIPSDYMVQDYGYEHLMSIQYAIDKKIYYMRWKNNG